MKHILQFITVVLIVGLLLLVVIPINTVAMLINKKTNFAKILQLTFDLAEAAVQGESWLEPETKDIN